MGGQEHTRERGGDRFPLILGLCCTTLAALLFVTGTLPALRERDDLRNVVESRRQALARLVRETEELRRAQYASTRDPQAVLVEIDALNLTPDELLAKYATDTPR
jgi:hypothetical protein